MHFAWTMLQAAAAPQGGGMFGLFVPMIVIFGIMYFFMIRPQAKKAKELQKMLEAITAGTDVVTTGGIHGTVKGVKGQHNEILIIQIAEGLKIEVDRAAVGRVKGTEGK